MNLIRLSPPHDESGAVGFRHVVFVNFYFPSDSDLLLKNTIMSAIEQIHQIGSSLTAMAPSPTNLQPVVYYSNIGGVSGAISTPIDEVCSQYNGQMKCHHLGHFDRGFEEVTLNTLYDYCREPVHESHRVAYDHNKGSYNPEGWIDPDVGQIRQDVWRRHGTAAAVNEMCLQPVDENCNVCGLLWTPIPWTFDLVGNLRVEPDCRPSFCSCHSSFQSPGNFWSAKCSYVKKLLHPSHFQTLHNHLWESTYMPRCDAEKMISSLPWPALMGAGRWSMEMWIGSHPSIRPCDLLAEPGIKHWQTADRNVSGEFNFSMFPRPDHDIRTLIEHSEPRHGTEVLDNERL